jgi:hypothetical protein
MKNQVKMTDKELDELMHRVHNQVLLAKEAILPKELVYT